MNTLETHCQQHQLLQDQLDRRNRLLSLASDYPHADTWEIEQERDGLKDELSAELGHIEAERDRLLDEDESREAGIAEILTNYGVILEYA